MKIERLQILFIFLVFFILIPMPKLRAQDSEEEAYLIRLTWAGDENALFYEVIIEKDDGEESPAVLRETTGESHIELTLPPGKYRSSVIPYDFLEKPGEGSLWISFEVIAPLQPEPELPYIEIIPEPVIPYEEEIVEPEKSEKFYNIYLSAAWMPVIPFYIEKAEFIGIDPALPAAAIHFGILFKKPAAFNIGMELGASWYAFNDTGGAMVHALTAGLNIVAQKRSPGGIIALNFRAGAGFSLLPDSREKTPQMCFLLNAGISFLVYPVDRLFIEIGIDNIHYFTEIASGCLRPRLGIGIQF